MPRRGAQYTFSPAQSVNVQILGPNPKRHYVQVSSPSSDAILISIGTPITSGNNAGFRMFHGQSNLILTYDDIGELIHQPWYGWSTAVSNNFTLVEGME